MVGSYVHEGIHVHGLFSTYDQYGHLYFTLYPVHAIQKTNTATLLDMGFGLGNENRNSKTK